MGSAYAAHKVFLQVELAGRGLVGFNGFQNLFPLILELWDILSEIIVYLDALSNDLYHQTLAFASEPELPRQRTSGPQWSPANTTMLCSAIVLNLLFPFEERNKARFIKRNPIEEIRNGKKVQRSVGRRGVCFAFGENAPR